MCPRAPAPSDPDDPPPPAPRPAPPPTRRHATPASPKELQPSRLARHLGRALLRRCPNCGARGIFELWLVMRDECPRCHLRFDRGEDDYFIGSFTINFVVAELVICAGALIGILATWPDVPWVGLKWALIALILPVPALFYPFARTLWLAIDLTFRPLRFQDLAGHGENTPAGKKAPPPPPLPDTLRPPPGG